jgi:hypothetical protein
MIGKFALGISALISMGGDFKLSKASEPRRPMVLQASGMVSREVQVGQPLPERSAFGLKRGDELILLDAKGVRVLRGPGVLVGGVFTRSGETGGDNSVLAVVAENSSAGSPATRTPEDYVCALTDECGSAGEETSEFAIPTKARVRTSATRGFSLSRATGKPSQATARPRRSLTAQERAQLLLSSSRPPKEADWYIDPSRTTTLCLPDQKSPVLVLPLKERSVKVRISDPKRGRSATLTLREGNALGDWPLPNIEIGDSYLLSVQDKSSVVLHVKALFAEVAGNVPPECTSQVETNMQLLQHLATPAPPEGR